MIAITLDYGARPAAESPSQGWSSDRPQGSARRGRSRRGQLSPPPPIFYKDVNRRGDNVDNQVALAVSRPAAENLRNWKSLRGLNQGVPGVTASWHGECKIS